eukprot:2831344-Alexandrium_andersonii.AAC.1
MVWTTPYLVRGAPLAFGKSGTAEGLSRAHAVQISRTRAAWRSTAHAGHRPGDKKAGAPGRFPQAHLRDRHVPSAVGSVLETGRHGCTATPSVRRSSSTMWEASTSRRSHQQPTTMRFSGPVGPPESQGSKPPGSSSARATEKAP